MRHLSALRRALAALGLVAGATGLVAATAQAQEAARPCRHPEFVTSTWEGHGLGSVLARAAVLAVTEAGGTVVPRCPFVAAWLRKHPDSGARVRWPED